MRRNMKKKEVRQAGLLGKGRMMQSIHIELSDGRKGIFSGPAIVLPKDQGRVLISRIEFTEPVPLPDDCHFEVLIGKQDRTNH